MKTENKIKRAKVTKDGFEVTETMMRITICKLDLYSTIFKIIYISSIKLC